MINKHPYNRKVFYIGIPAVLYSLREIQNSVIAGTLNPRTIISDTDGGSYTAGNIADGQTPKWARTAEHDPAFFGGLPKPTAESIALAEEVLSEPGFLEMPEEQHVFL